MQFIRQQDTLQFKTNQSKVNLYTWYYLNITMQGVETKERYIFKTTRLSNKSNILKECHK